MSAMRSDFVFYASTIAAAPNILEAMNGASAR